MEKIGVKDVQDGFTSENMRSCIDKLHYHIVVHRSQTAIVNPSRTKPKFLTKNPETLRSPHKCPKLDEGELEEMGYTNLADLCQKCKTVSYREWRDCDAKVS